MPLVLQPRSDLQRRRGSRRGASSRRSRAQLTAQRPGCAEQGYSDCGPDEYRHGRGHVVRRAAGSAAAAALAPRSVPAAARREPGRWLLTRSARRRVAPARLHVVPAGPRRHVAAGAGSTSQRRSRLRWPGACRRATLRAERRRGRARPRRSGAAAAARSRATLDFWDDQSDVYRVYLRQRQRITLALGARGPRDARARALEPGTERVDALTLGTDAAPRRAVGAPRGSARAPHLPRAGRRAGWYYVQVKLDRAGRRRATRSRSRSSALAGRSRRGASLILEQLVLGHVAQHARRVADDDVRGGTSFVTTAPAPTNASSPTSMPGQRMAPPPTRAPRRIVGPLISSWRCSVRPMKLSFVVTTHGAMKTFSSSVEYAVMYASAWIFVSAPDGRVVLDQRAAADDDVVADLAALAHARLVADDHARAEASCRRRRSRPSRRSSRPRSRAGGSGSRFAVERGESVGCLPTTAPSQRPCSPSPSTVPG